MEIEKYIHPEVILMFNNSSVLTISNDIELARVQLKIAEGQFIGYSINFNGENIPIDLNGNLESWPKGLYDEWSITISKVFKVRRFK